MKRARSSREAREPAQMYEAFAVGAPGIEPLVATELAALGVSGQAVDGGVEFSASKRQLYEANLQLRTASRILIRLARFRALTFAELERRAQRIPWERVLESGQPVALRVTCRKSRLYHSDAVAERLARDLTARFAAEVTTTSPDDEMADPRTVGAQLIVVRFDHDHCTVSADSSGAHLHQRGYRTSGATAPVRETLAAALVLASEWDRRSPVLDPFCGSGTIPIEAALIAARVAPGRNRLFQFMRWPGYDAPEWSRLHAAAVKGEKGEIPSIRGSDRSAGAIRAAIENAERAGMAGKIAFERWDAMRIDTNAPSGWIISNPPYGVRLGTAQDARRLMTQFAQRLRQRFPGWRLGLLAPASFGRIPGLVLTPGIRTTNGGLRVQMLLGQVTSARTPTGA